MKKRGHLRDEGEERGAGDSFNDIHTLSVSSYEEEEEDLESSSVTGLFSFYSFLLIPLSL